MTVPLSKLWYVIPQLSQNSTHATDVFLAFPNIFFICK